MQTPVEYHITETTNIAKISQAKLLSHPKTKHQLTSYLGQALLDDASSNGCHVVAWGTRSKASFSDKHCTKTYISTTWESIGYADGNVLNPAN